jgi:hypothetical protein
MNHLRFPRLAGALLLLLATAACGEKEIEKIPPPVPEAPALPSILSFAAAPEAVTAGETATLHWTTTNVVALELLDGKANAIPLDGVDVARGSVEVQPAETTAYTLVATGADPTVGQARRTVTVAVTRGVVDAPTVESFTSSATVVPLGDEVVLSWRTTGASSVTIKDDAGWPVDLGGAAIAEGQVAVRPTRSPSTYTLLAAGQGGRASATVSVDVAGLPRIAKFFVDPIAPVPVGGTVELVWETANTSRVTIRQGATTVVDTNAAAGRKEVVLADNASFELEAEGPGGVASASAMARVGPRILAFSASDRVVREGDPIVLRWQTDDADRAVIDGPAGYHLEIGAATLASGEVTVEVEDRGEFVLQAFRQNVPLAAKLAVDVTTAPRIRDLQVDRTVVTAARERPAPVVVSWRQDGADTCAILANNSAVDTFPCGTVGSREVSVRGTTNLRFEARNASGQHARTITVQAVAPAQILAFARHPARRVAPGETIELSWTVAEADAVELTKNGLPVSIDPTAFVGSVTDTVDLDSVYALTARNSLGDPTVAEITATTGAPVILTAEANPSFVGIGDAFEIRWTADGGDELTITGPTDEVEFRTEDQGEIDAGSATLLAPLEAGAYTYTVAVANGAGAGLPVEIPVTVSDGPMIRSFTIDPAAISLGGSATLSWSVANDPHGVTPTLSLVDDQGNTYPEIAGKNKNPNQDTLVVTPTAEGVYVFTLTASTPNRTPATATVILDVSVAPAVVSFTASSTLVSTEGGTVIPDVVLTWESRNAVEFTIWEKGPDGELIPPPLHRASLALGDDQAELDAGTFTVHPTASTTYVARARNRIGSDALKEVRVVVDPPSITSFVATPPEIREGGSATLSWTTHNATAVELEPVAVRRLGNTFIDVSGSPTATASTLAGDTAVATIPFPAGFTFPFGGANRTAIQVSSNGWAGFNTANTGAGGYTPELPNSSKFANFILYGADLDPSKNSPAGQVWYDMASDAEGDFFVVQFKNWSWYSSTYNPSDLNFELILRPSGNFEYRYGTMTAKTDARAAGEGASVGFQFPDANSFGMQVVPYQKVAAGGLANTGFAFDVRLPVNGSITVNPGETTTYKLTALNADTSVTAETTVILWKNPVISSARIEPAPPMANEPFDVIWEVQEATRVRVVDASGETICDVVEPMAVLSGRCTTSVAAQGIGTLTVVADNGPLVAPVASTSKTVQFLVMSQLSVDSLEVTPKFPAAAGDTVTITWTASGALDVSLSACTPGTTACTDITPAGARPASGSATYAINGSTEFVLQVEDIMGRTASRRAGAYLDPAHLDSFTASASQLAGGETVTLTWDSTNATSVEIVPSLLAEDATGALPFIELEGNGGIELTRSGTSYDTGLYTLTFPVGFRFPWFGQQITALQASIDGWLGFNTANTATNGTNYVFPTSTTYDEVAIAPFWDDLEATLPAKFLWKLDQTPQGMKYLVVEWKDFEDYTDGESSFNFEVILWENGDFDIRYGVMRGGASYVEIANGKEATIGFQNPNQTFGHTVSHNAVVPGGLSHRAWRFRPSMITPPLDGTLTFTPAGSTTYEVCATNTSGYRDCRSVRVVVVRPGSLLFSEAMIAPASPDAEWFEIRNMTPDPLDLSLGTWTVTAGAGEEYTFPATAPVVPPGGYLVLARSDLAAVNGGLTPDLVYGSALTLDDAADTLALSLNGEELDRISWDASWTIPADQAIAAEAAWLYADPVSNDPAYLWCPVAAPYGNGTFTGSPGTAGDSCWAPTP